MLYYIIEYFDGYEYFNMEFLLDVIHHPNLTSEPTAPLIEARFFEWFVRRVLPLTRSVALKMGVDQGLDKTWCSAAKVYGKRVLNHSKE